MSSVLHTDDLDPDGVQIIIPWLHLQVGMSIFVPCINHKRAIAQFTKIAVGKNMHIRHQVTTCNDILGVRFWRTT